MHFIKFTNKDELHHGIQYKTGLNEDILPFESNPIISGRGGMYFTDIYNIMNYIDYGIYIRDVYLQEDSLVVEEKNMLLGRSWRTNKFILGERKLIKDYIISNAVCGHFLDYSIINGISDLFYYSISINNEITNKSIQLSSRYNQFDFFKHLYTNYSFNYHDINNIIHYTIKNGNLDMLLYMYEYTQFSFHYDHINIITCYGHLYMMKFIINKYNITLQCYHLDTAIRHGHLDMIKYFITSHGLKCNILHIEDAIRYNNIDMIVYLYQNLKYDYTAFTFEKAKAIATQFNYINIINFFNTIDINNTIDNLNFNQITIE